MTQIEKLVRQFLERPTALRYSQMKKVLEYLGFEEISVKGSHRKFKHPQIEKDLIIPVHNNDCKDFYKKFAVKIIEKNNLC